MSMYFGEMRIENVKKCELFTFKVGTLQLESNKSSLLLNRQLYEISCAMNKLVVKLLKV